MISPKLIDQRPPVVVIIMNAINTGHISVDFNPFDAASCIQLEIH